MNNVICDRCKKEIEDKKNFIKIVSRYNKDKVIFQSTKTTIREAVIEAIDSDANLSDANLSYTNLSDANLSYADLSHAKLSYADLSHADLSYAKLSYTDLSHANLSYADLSHANLSDAKTNMCKVNFSSDEYDQAKQFIKGLK